VRAKYKKNYINHLERTDNTRLPKYALNYKPRGRRDRERPRKRSMEDDDDDDDDVRYVDKSYTNKYCAWNSNRRSPYYKLEIIDLDTTHSLT
jgi:hypothetical protein